jgi:hypothetical protein
MSKIRIEIASDTDYEKLIANIYIDEAFAGLVHQESGRLSYEIPPPDKAIGLIRSVDADVMIDAINRAKRELIKGDLDDC